MTFLAHIKDRATHKPVEQKIFEADGITIALADMWRYVNTLNNCYVSHYEIIR